MMGHKVFVVFSSSDGGNEHRRGRAKPVPAPPCHLDLLAYQRRLGRGDCGASSHDVSFRSLLHKIFVKRGARCARLIHPVEGYLTMNNVQERVKKIVVEQLGVNEDDVTDSASFVDDLGADSLDTVELVMALEEEFECEIPDEEAEKITTVQQAIDYINTHSE